MYRWAASSRKEGGKKASLATAEATASLTWRTWTCRMYALLFVAS